MDDLDDFFKEIAETEKAAKANIAADAVESAASGGSSDGAQLSVHAAAADNKLTAPTTSLPAAASKSAASGAPVRAAPLVPRAALVPAAALRAKPVGSFATSAAAVPSQSATAVHKAEEEDAEIDILKLLPFGAKAGSGVTNIRPVAPGSKVFAAVPRQLAPKQAGGSASSSSATPTASASSGGAAVLGVIVKPPVTVAASKPPQPAAAASNGFGSGPSSSSSSSSAYPPVPAAGAWLGSSSSVGGAADSASFGAAAGSSSASSAAAAGGAGAAAAGASEEESAAGVGQKRKKPGLLRSCAGETWMDPTLAEWPEDDFRLFCGDLGNEVTDDILASAFRHYGSFAKAKVVRDSRSHKSKGYGFVSFLDHKDALDALTRMHGQYVGNRPVRLRRCNLAEKDAMEVRRKDAEREQMKRKVLGL